MSKKDSEEPNKKKASQKSSVDETQPSMIVSKKLSKKEKPSERNYRFSNFFREFKENISEGAKSLTDLSIDILEEVKDKAEDLYGKGTEKFEQASGVVEGYIERYKNEKEIKELTKEKEELNAVLGRTIYHEFKKNGTVSKRFLTTKKSSELFSSIESVDKRILQLGKELDKK